MLRVKANFICKKFMGKSLQETHIYDIMIKKVIKPTIKRVKISWQKKNG